MARRATNATVTRDAVLLHQTEKAYKFEIDGEELWLPKSRCEWSPSARDDTEGVVEMDMSIAKEKGLD